METHFSTPCSRRLGWLAVLVFLPVWLLAAGLAQAQAPAWQTAAALGSDKSSGGAASYSVVAMAPGAAGNVYLAGVFHGTVSFGGTTLISTNADPNNPDGFVAKWNLPTNSFVWVQRLAQTGTGTNPGSNFIFPTGVAFVGTSVYVAGVVNGGAQLGPLNLPASGGGNDAFVTRLTDAGNSGTFAWARRAAGGGADYGITLGVSLAVSGTSIYVAGGFRGTLGFGSTTLIGGANGSNDSKTFVAKLTDTGPTTAFAWALTEVVPAGSGGSNAIQSLAVRGNNVYVAGRFESPTARFGATTLSQAGTGSRTSDGFVAQLTDAGSTGSYTAAQRAGGGGRDGFRTLAVTGTGVYAAGDFDPAFPLTFGSTAVPTPANGSLLAKWNPTTGNFGWVQAAPGSRGTGNEADFGALAASGPALYLAGQVRASATDLDAVLFKYTDTGTGAALNWAARSGNSGDNYAEAVALSGGRVYAFVLSTSQSMTFGSLNVPNAYYQAANPRQGRGGFLATLTDPMLTATRPAQAGPPPAVYPNPAHGAATVRWPAGSAPAPLVLLDALGRAVRRYPAPTGTETTLDVRGLPAGLYVLRHGAGSQRLVVE